MSSPLLRRGLAALTSIAVAGSVALMVPTAADAAPTQKRAYGGSAYGSSAKFENLVNSGRTAALPLCTTVTGPTRTNTSAAVDLDGLGSIGATTTTIQRVKSGSTQSTITTTRTADVELGGLNGISSLVEAESVVTTAKVTFDGRKYVKTGSTTFVGLTVAGQEVADLTPDKNTEIDLPLGLGTVILNQQTTSDAFDNYTQTVVGLRVVVEGDLPELGSGQVVVAFASASLHSPKFARAFGNAYATYIKAGDVLTSGPTALVDLPCGGTSGKTRTNNILEAGGGVLDNLVEAGAATTTAKSTDSSTATNATTTATIADVDLFDGAVTADAITAKASTTRSGSKLTRTSAGTTIADLRINNAAVNVTGDANQRVNVAGVGTLYLRRSSLTDTGLQVFALQLVLTEEEDGLPIGTVINIGSASSGVSTT